MNMREKKPKAPFYSCSVRAHPFHGKSTFGKFWNGNGSAEECFTVKPGDLVDWEQGAALLHLISATLYIIDKVKL